jgi:LmbE family N-acetylglucosaminyl deacetylase
VDILAIGAHPDDVELGCGGLLIKAAGSGHNAYIYTVTPVEAFDVAKWSFANEFKLRKIQYQEPHTQRNKETLKVEMSTLV